MNFRCTAQLIVSEVEAYVAYSDRREALGPNGEPWIARIMCTEDGGVSWHAIAWRRTVRSRIRHPGYPTWPPEAVISIVKNESALTILHRDEWVPFEPGGESLWESTLRDGLWSVRHVRLMNYEDSDPAASIAEIVLALPPSMLPPN